MQERETIRLDVNVRLVVLRGGVRHLYQSGWPGLCCCDKQPQYLSSLK
jgi:hypothetical protein